MKTQELIKQYNSRIDMLLDRLDEAKLYSKDPDQVLIDACYLGTVGIIDALYGKNSSQAKALIEFKKAYTKTTYLRSHELRSLGESVRGVLINISEELDQGLIRNIASEVAGELIGDLVALAKTELNAGYKQVASVLASVALEDALKRKVIELGLSVENKNLSSIINTLKSKGLLSGAQGPIVSSYVKLRNAAMHAEWEKINEADVSSLIGFLEPFLLEHFV